MSIRKLQFRALSTEYREKQLLLLLLKPWSSTQVWAFCSETRAFREADIS